MRTIILSTANKLHNHAKCHTSLTNITNRYLPSTLKFSSTTTSSSNKKTAATVPSDDDDNVESPEPSGGSTNFAFDRRVKHIQKERAARYHLQQSHNPNKIDYDYFRTEVASRLVERLDDILREDGFPLALDIGAGPGYVYRAICSDEGIDGVGGIGGVRKLVQLESSGGMLHRDENDGDPIEGEERCGTYRLEGNEEGTLPFPDGTFDLVISSASLHWVNDLPGLLLEAKRVLKPDGCLIFAMVGGSSTLMELRSSLVLAEMERDGGVSTHVGPFVDVSDVGSLLTNAGFALTTVDVDTILLSYPNAMVLMEHLQRMGEGNACVNRRDSVSRGTFLGTACLYDEMYPLGGGDGRGGEGGGDEVEATVQVIYAIGWTPHESQQKPDKRGTATGRIGETVVEKTTAGDVDIK